MSLPTTRRILSQTLMALGVVACVFGSAEATQTLHELGFHDGRFEPVELVVTAGEPFKLRVTNKGDDAIEFESFELHRERAVRPGESIEINFPSLEPGSYKFFDDFHEDVPPGAIVVK